MKQLNTNINLANHLPNYEKEKKLARQAIDDNYLFDTWLKDQEIDPKELEQVIDNNVFKISNWLNSIHYCNSCQSLNECPYNNKGVRPWLSYNGAFIQDDIQYCPYKVDDDNKYQFLNNFVINDYPLIYKDANMSQLELLRSKNHDASSLIVGISRWLKSDKKKGFYIFGPFGSGKSYTSIILSNYMAQNGYKVCYINFNSFVTRSKNSLSLKENNLNNDLFNISHADFTVIDDLGIDNNSAWIRDDLLYPILNYRMEHQLPTVITSNFTLEELENYLAITKDGDNDKLKAKRIMERIKTMCVAYNLDGKSMRY